MDLGGCWSGVSGFRKGGDARILCSFLGIMAETLVPPPADEDFCEVLPLPFSCSHLLLCERFISGVYILKYVSYYENCEKLLTINLNCYKARNLNSRSTRVHKKPEKLQNKRRYIQNIRKYSTNTDPFNA